MKLVAISAATLLSLSLVGVASAQEPDPGLPGEVGFSISPSCGSAVITFTNSTPNTFFGDYWVDDEAGTADDVTGQNIAEGPLAGEPFGEVHNVVEIAAGATVNVPVEFEEDQSDKAATLSVIVNRGPEQFDYVPLETVSINTDCALDSTPAPTTTTPAPTTTTETETPAQDDDTQVVQVPRGGVETGDGSSL